MKHIISKKYHGKISKQKIIIKQKICFILNVFQAFQKQAENAYLVEILFFNTISMEMVKPMTMTKKRLDNKNKVLAYFRSSKSMLTQASASNKGTNGKGSQHLLLSPQLININTPELSTGIPGVHFLFALVLETDA